MHSGLMNQQLKVDGGDKMDTLIEFFVTNDIRTLVYMIAVMWYFTSRFERKMERLEDRWDIRMQRTEDRWSTLEKQLSDYRKEADQKFYDMLSRK